MSDLNKKKDKEIWKLWDSLFSGGFISFLKDCEDAQNDDQKFKQILLQTLFSIVFTAILFGFVFLIVT